MQEVGGERLHGQLDGATGAGHLVLVDDHRIRRVLADGGGHVIPLVTHDDLDVRRLEVVRGGEHVGDHRQAGDRVQHLGAAGPHTRALPGGENDDGEARIGHGVHCRGCEHRPWRAG